MSHPRIDIRQRVRHLRRDPRGDDRQKIEKLRISLAPLLVELNRLQTAAGVFQCAPTAPMEQQGQGGDLLATWDIYVQDFDDEAPAAAAAPTPRHTNLTGLDESELPVEEQVLFIPSNGNVTPCNDNLELTFRKNQANAHLNQLRELIAEKSFQYSDVIRKAPRKGVRTRSRGTIKGINTQISLHCQVYTHCRSRLIDLHADTPTLQQFRELKKEDIKASTAILNPNVAGSTTLQLSWIWQDTRRHILPVDADIIATDAATILECMLSNLYDAFVVLLITSSQTCPLAACPSTTYALARRVYNGQL